MIPPQRTFGPDHGERRGPHGWSGPLIVIFLLLAALFAYLMLALDPGGGPGVKILLAVGTVVSLGVSGLLLRWRVRG